MEIKSHVAEPNKVMIEGQTYTFHHMNVFKAHNLLTRIGKIVAPGLGKSLSGSKDVLDQDINLGVLLSEAFERIDPDNSINLIQEVLSETHHAGSGRLADNFLMHFEKHGLFHMYKVFFEAVKIYFGDFFSKGLGKQNM